MSGYQSVISCLGCFRAIEENYRQIDVLSSQLIPLHLEIMRPMKI